MNSIRNLVAVALAASLAACGGKQEAAEPVLPAVEVPVVGSKPVDAPSVIDPVDSLFRRLADNGYATQSGTLSDGLLTNDGKDGYLLFGPYVPFKAGTYTASIKGALLDLPAGGKVRLDAASHKGKEIHGGVDVSTPGELPTFEFTLSESVADLEVRVRTTGNAKVNIESYQVLSMKKP